MTTGFKLMFNESFKSVKLMFDDMIDKKRGKNSDGSDVNFLLQSGILENVKKMNLGNHNTKKLVIFLPTYSNLY